MDIFNIENQFKLYLDRAGVTKEQLNPIQYQEMRRAFYGSWGQCLLCLRDDVTKLSEKEGTKTLDKMLNEIENFWLSEQNKQN